MNSFWNGFEKQAATRQENIDAINAHNSEMASHGSAIPVGIGAGLRKGVPIGTGLGLAGGLFASALASAFARRPKSEYIDAIAKMTAKGALQGGAIGALGGGIIGHVADGIAKQDHDFSDVSDDLLAEGARKIKSTGSPNIHNKSYLGKILEGVKG